MHKIKGFTSRFIFITWIFLSLVCCLGRCRAREEKQNETVDSYLLRMDHVIKSVVFGEQLVRKRMNDAGDFPLTSNFEDFNEFLELFRHRSTQFPEKLNQTIHSLIETVNKNVSDTLPNIKKNMDCLHQFIHMYAGLKTMNYFYGNEKKRDKIQEHVKFDIENYLEIDRKELTINFSSSNTLEKAEKLVEAIIMIDDIAGIRHKTAVYLSNYFSFINYTRQISKECEEKIAAPNVFNLHQNADLKFIRNLYLSAQRSLKNFERFSESFPLVKNIEIRKKFSRMIGDIYWILNSGYIQSSKRSNLYSRSDKKSDKNYVDLPMELDSRLELAEDALEVYAPTDNFTFNNNSLTKFQNLFKELSELKWNVRFEDFSKKGQFLQYFPKKNELGAWSQSATLMNIIGNTFENKPGLIEKLKSHVKELNISSVHLEKIVKFFNLLDNVAEIIRWLKNEQENRSKNYPVNVYYEFATSDLFQDVVGWLDVSRNESFHFEKGENQIISDSLLYNKSYVIEVETPYKMDVYVKDHYYFFTTLFEFLENSTKIESESKDVLEKLRALKTLSEVGEKTDEEEEKAWLKIARDWASFQFPQDLEVDRGLDWLVNNSEYETVIEKGVEAFQKVCEINRNATNETNETNNDEFSIIEWSPNESSRKIDIVLSKLNQSIEWLDLEMKISESANISDGINWENLSNNIRNMTQFLEKWNKMVKQKHIKFFIKQFDINITKFSGQSNTFKNTTIVVKTDIIPFIRKTSGIFGCFLSVCNIIIVLYIIYKSFGRILKQKKKH